MKLGFKGFTGHHCHRLLGTLAFALLAACTTPAAYGPSGDERLARAVDGGDEQAGLANAQHLAEIQRHSCGDLAGRVSDLQTPPPMDAGTDPDEEAPKVNLEEEHLAALTGAVRELRRRRGAMGDILGSRPDLGFFSGAAADGRHYDVPELARECDLLLEQAELALDAFIREIPSMPIISEVERVGRRVRSVPRERVDFALLATSVEILAPFDADRLMGRVEAARTRLEEEKEAARRPPRRRRR